MAKMLKIVGAMLEGIASASVEIQTGVEKPKTEPDANEMGIGILGSSKKGTNLQNYKPYACFPSLYFCNKV